MEAHPADQADRAEVAVTEQRAAVAAQEQVVRATLAELVPLAQILAAVAAAAQVRLARTQHPQSVATAALELHPALQDRQ